MEHDSVNHPAHYTDGSIEVIDFIEDKRLSYHLSNAVKYIARAGKKDPEKIAENGMMESTNRRLPGCVLRKFCTDAYLNAKLRKQISFAFCKIC